MISHKYILYSHCIEKDGSLFVRRDGLQGPIKPKKKKKIYTRMLG
jgi:hypothetical protein